MTTTSRWRRTGLVLLAACSLLPGGVFGQDRHYKDLGRDAVRTGGPGQQLVGGVSGSVTFYRTRDAFRADHPGLPLEDFSGTLVGPAGREVCPPPANSETDNACFSPGAILAGLSMDLNPGPGFVDLVVFGVGRLGNQCVTVGPGQFQANGRIDLDPPVRAIGFDFLDLNTPGSRFIIVVRGEGGKVLAQTEAVAGDAPLGLFWGVATDDRGGITRLNFQGESLANGELYCNVEFGGVPVPVELQSFTVE